MSPEKFSIRWVKHKYKDRFFADPFLYKVDDENFYILVEEFPFYDNKGYISLLTVSRKSMKLLKKEKLIEEDWHLSYPFVKNGCIIPEAYRSGKVYEYDKQGDQLKRNVVINKGLIDQTFVDYNGVSWVFATDKDDALGGLKILYKKPKDEDWIEHKLNPVKKDITNSRPGGKFFLLDDKLYRPVQDSKERYGRRIRIMRIDKLSEEEFEESEIAVLDSDKFPPYNKGMHTFNVENSFIVVDGYKETHSFFVKPLCIKFPRLMKKFGDNK